MTRMIVGVLRGGNSSEYDLSLKTGAVMIASLPEEKYDVRDIFIDRYGIWHMRGVPIAPARILAQIDVVLNGMHGGMGEDGTVGRILELSGVRYAGSHPMASGTSLHKVRAREVLRAAGVRMPLAVSFSMSKELTTADMAQAVFSQFGPPYIVKPAFEGAGHGIKIASSLVELPDVIGDVLDEYGNAIVEEFVRGRHATVGVVENFRGRELYAFPPAETVLPEDKQIIDRDVHVMALARHRCPSAFTHDEKRAISELALNAHRALSLSHYSRADMIVTPRGAYLLEVNALPGLYEGAPLPEMLSAVGASTGDLCEHLISLALKP